MPEVSEIIRITSRIVPRGELRKTFGVTLFLTTDDNNVLDAAGPGRIQTYGKLSDLTDAGFPTDSEPYLAARTYFAQDPFPKALIVGRWAKANVPSRLVGGKLSITAPNAAMKNATATFVLRGEDHSINSASITTFTAYATALQAEVRSELSSSNITVTWDATEQRFTLEAPDQQDFSDLASPTGAGTDISGLIGWTAETGAKAILGNDAEDVEDALNAVEDLDSSFYFICIEKTENDADSAADISAWAAAKQVQSFLESSDTDVLTTAESGSPAAVISALESARTNFSWSSKEKYLNISAAARLSGVNMNGVNSLITLNLKTMPNVDPDIDLTATQINELMRKNINYYTKFGASSAYRDGRNLKPGIWTDVQFFVDWFVNATQTAAFNALYSSNRIPQTPTGIATIREAIEGVCQNAIRNGGIAPGTVAPSTKADIISVTGNEEFNGFLSNGYLIHAGSLADQAQSDREARNSPPFRVWLKGSGAVHQIDIDITMEQ